MEPECIDMWENQIQRYNNGPAMREYPTLREPAMREYPTVREPFVIK